MSTLKKFKLTLLSLSILLVSACSMDPNVEITQKNVGDALSSLSQSEAAKVQALGGEKYLIGKTLSKVKSKLDGDYKNFEIKQLIEHARLNREFNLSQMKKGELTAENIRSDFAENDEEKKLEFAELSQGDRYLRLVRAESKKAVPLGSAVLEKGVLSCRKKEDLISLDKLERENAAEFEKQKKLKIRRKECHLMKKKATMTLRTEAEGFGGQPIFLTARGWVDGKDLSQRTPQEELDRLREEANSKLNSLIELPAPQFYHALRPLFDISPKNVSRIKLAQKAIAINMAESKLPWNQAALKFLEEQKEFARSEYMCQFENSCQKNEQANLRMAHYILAPAPKDVKFGALPCEISKVSGCSN